MIHKFCGHMQARHAGINDLQRRVRGVVQHPYDALGGDHDPANHAISVGQNINGEIMLCARQDVRRYEKILIDL